MSANAVQTDYSTLANRCPNCPHRLNMGQGSRCTVVVNTSDKSFRDPTNDKPCRCRKHHR